MKKNTLYLILFVVSVLCFDRNSHAQFYSDFTYNTQQSAEIFNPAIVGENSANGMLFMPTFYANLTDMSLVNMQNFVVSVPMNKISSGVGLLYNSESFGFISVFQTGLSYSYKIKFKNSKLSLGVQPFVFHYYHNGSYGYEDYAANYSKFNATGFRIGAYYKKNQFYIGLSLKQIISIFNKENYYSGFRYTDNYARLLIGRDFVFGNSKFSLEPVLLCSSNLSTINLDMSIYGTYNDILSLGFVLAECDLIFPGIEIKVMKKMILGYSVGLDFNPILNDGILSHTFLIKYVLSDMN